MSTTEAPDTVLRRIRGLLDQAERTPFPAEAEAFAAKAAELMARHRIDEAALVRRPDGPEATRVVEIDVELGRGQYVRARLALLGEVADALDCRILTRVGIEGRIAHVIGQAADVDRVALLYTSLLVQATRAGTAEQPPRGHGGVEFRRGFLFGFAERVGQRLQAEMAAAVARADAARPAADAAAGSAGDGPAGSVALVLADRRRHVDDWVRDRYGRVSTLAPASRVTRSSLSRGRVAGDRADLHGGAGVAGPRPAIGR
jgi:hypothetical protein